MQAARRVHVETFPPQAPSPQSIPLHPFALNNPPTQASMLTQIPLPAGTGPPMTHFSATAPFHHGPPPALPQAHGGQAIHHSPSPRVPPQPAAMLPSKSSHALHPSYSKNVHTNARMHPYRRDSAPGILPMPTGAGASPYGLTQTFAPNRSSSMTAYVTPQDHTSNLAHRPVPTGVQLPKSQDTSTKHSSNTLAPLPHPTCFPPSMLYFMKPHSQTPVLPFNPQHSKDGQASLSAKEVTGPSQVPQIAPTIGVIDPADIATSYGHHAVTSTSKDFESWVSGDSQ